MILLFTEVLFNVKIFKISCSLQKSFNFWFCSIWNEHDSIYVNTLFFSSINLNFSNNFVKTLGFKKLIDSSILDFNDDKISS